MTRVPRPLDISWNEQVHADGTVTVTHRPGPRWLSWMSGVLALPIFAILGRMAVLWLREPGELLLLAAMLTTLGVAAMLVLMAMRNANDKTLTLANRSLELAQRLEPKRRNLHVADVTRLVIRQRGTSWDLTAQSVSGGDVHVPFAFRSVAHAEYAASRIAHHLGAEFAIETPASRTAAGGKRWEQTLTSSGATLRYRETHPAQVIGAIMTAFLFLMNLGMVQPSLVTALIAVNAVFAAGMLAFRTNMLMSPNSIAVSHPLSFGRGAKVQGTIESFTVRKDFLAWTVVALTSDGNATPIGMFSRKESEARATAENLNEVLRSVRSNAATGYRVGSVSALARVPETGEADDSGLPEGALVRRKLGRR